MSSIVDSGLPNQIIDARSDARRFPKVCGASIDIGAMRTGGGGRERDLDAIPDDREVVYGLNENDPGDAGSDLDGEGPTALEEHFARTVLNFAESALNPGVLRSNVSSNHRGRHFCLAGLVFSPGCHL